MACGTTVLSRLYSFFQHSVNSQVKKFNEALNDVKNANPTFNEEQAYEVALEIAAPQKGGIQIDDYFGNKDYKKLLNNKILILKELNIYAEKRLVVGVLQTSNLATRNGQHPPL